MFYITKKSDVLKKDNTIDIDSVLQKAVFMIFFAEDMISVNKYRPVPIRECNLQLFNKSEDANQIHEVHYGDSKISFDFDNEVFSIFFYERNIRNKAIRNEIIEEYLFLVDSDDGFIGMDINSFIVDLFVFFTDECNS